MKLKILHRLLLLASGVFLSQILYAQSPGVHGRVVSAENNEPLIGVTVVVKDKNQGAQTDLEGRFQVPAAIGEVLVFRYTGFDAQEVAVKSTTEPITVSLKPT